jgi:anti-anti-sigma factor
VGDAKVQVEGERTSEGTVRARVVGEIDLGTGDQVDAALRRLTGDGVDRLELDLSGVVFIDSVGLRVLLDVRDHVAQHGGTVTIVASSDHTSRLLTLTGLADLFSPGP